METKFIHHCGGTFSTREPEDLYGFCPEFVCEGCGESDAMLVLETGDIVFFDTYDPAAYPKRLGAESYSLVLEAERSGSGLPLYIESAGDDEEHDDGASGAVN